MYSYENCTYWDAKKEGGVVMKKKGLLVGLCMSAALTMLTGCVNTESLSKEVVVQGTNQDHIAYELEDWKRLINEVDTLSEYNDEDAIWAYDRSSDSTSKSTYVGEDSSYIWIQNIDSERGRKAIQFIENYVGNELEQIITEARALKVDEAEATKMIEDKGAMITRNINDYVVIAQNIGGKIGIYVMHEPFILKQEVDQDFINQFKTDSFLLKAFSQGTQESLIEIATPSFMIRNNGSFLHNSTSYYQFFRNADNELTKTRMVINVYADHDIVREEFEPLEKVIASLGGEADLSTAIQNEVSQIIQGNSEGKMLKSGDLKCTIKKHDGTIYQEKLIEIVIE